MRLTRKAVLAGCVCERRRADALYFTMEQHAGNLREDLDSINDACASEFRYVYISPSVLAQGNFCMGVCCEVDLFVDMPPFPPNYGELIVSLVHPPLQIDYVAKS